MNDRSWKIDFEKVGVMLLPTFLRKPLLVKYVRVMMSGIASIHGRVTAYRGQVSYELSLSGQVCRLRCLLNDAFDSEQRRIMIVDVDQKPNATLLWQRDEKRGLIIGVRDNGGVAISCRGYEGIKQPDFEVVMPAMLVVDEKRLAALVNSHKLAGKLYKITKLI